MGMFSMRNFESSRLVPLATVLLGSIALIGLAFIAAPVLVPGLLLLAILFLLFPLRKNRLVVRLMLIAFLLVLLWFLLAVSEILLPFIIGMLLVYVINPIVTKLNERGIPRWASSLVFVLLLFGGVTAIVAIGTPRLLSKADSIDAGLRTMLHQLTAAIESGKTFPGIGSYGAAGTDAGKAVTQGLGPQVSSFAIGMLMTLLDFLTECSRVAQHIINLAVLPFFMFFLLKDLPLLAAWVVDALPPRHREQFVAVVGRLDNILGRYFRGAIVVAAIQGGISGAGLWLIGIDHPVLLGVLTGFMDFVPYVGLFISLIVSALVAYAAGGAFLTNIILITALYLSQKLLETTVLAPKIIGPHVGLHPVLLIMSLILFEYFMGFVGLLIAIPVSALLMAAARAWSDSQPPKDVIPSTT